MAKAWLLEARVRELEHAYREAVKLGDAELARHWNQEIIKTLLELTHVLGNTERTSGTDTGI
jgi:hypothetical protein